MWGPLGSLLVCSKTLFHDLLAAARLTVDILPGGRCASAALPPVGQMEPVWEPHSPEGSDMNAVGMTPGHK